jgi:uncharacterized membrane protein YkoI
VLVLLAGASTHPGVALARERAPSRQAEASGGLSLDDAVRQVRRETGGRVLSADAIEDRGRAAYRIKVLLPSGHVRVMVIDAQSGARR